MSLMFRLSILALLIVLDVKGAVVFAGMVSLPVAIVFPCTD